MARATFKVHDQPSKHGILTLASGQPSPPALDQETAMVFLSYGVLIEVISLDEEKELIQQIKASGLPVSGTVGEGGAMLRGEDVKLIARAVGQLLLEMEESQLAGDDGMIIITDKPLVSFGEFDVFMPVVCLAGCHPTILHKNGEIVGFDSVKNAKEARDLVNGWGKKFGFSWWRTRLVRSTVVQNTARYNDVFAAYKAEAQQR